jgi:uncharacterized protein YqjF (DUF2071 family)
MRSARASIMNPVDRIDHRPWPLPRGPWVMAQVWHDLLFAHWPIARGAMRAAIPPALELDTFEGEAWLGVVPFHMSGVRVRGTPPVPWLSAFPELNLRTYVRHGGKPGVWFFALDAANPLAVEIARRWFHLPYFRARMSAVPISVAGAYVHAEARVAHGARVSAEARASNAAHADERAPTNERSIADETGIEYSSRRTDPRGQSAELEARYVPTGPKFRAQSGTLEHWLTERYCLYALDARERLLRSEIHHHPWPLQRAHAELERCTLPAAHGLDVPSIPPLLHFARRLDVIVWRPRRVE